MSQADHEEDGRKSLWFKALAIVLAVGAAGLLMVAVQRLRQWTEEGWLHANCSGLVRPATPEDAAILVVRRYEVPGEASYVARPDREAEGLTSKRLRFIVSRNGQDCAKVWLVPFLDLGWQEGSYERLGDCCPPTSP